MNTTTNWQDAGAMKSGEAITDPTDLFDDAFLNKLANDMYQGIPESEAPGSASAPTGASAALPDVKPEGGKESGVVGLNTMTNGTPLSGETILGEKFTVEEILPASTPQENTGFYFMNNFLPTTSAEFGEAESVVADFSQQALKTAVDFMDNLSIEDNTTDAVISSILPTGSFNAPTNDANYAGFYFLPSDTLAASENIPASTFNVQEIRKDFPILHQKVNGKPLIWFDNGATSQKPLAVIDRISNFYKNDNSNVHRGAHTLAARATDAYESTRTKVKEFIGASSETEIIFVRGTTEAINLVANTFGARNVQRGDEIVVSTLEHHSNIVPWQMLAQKNGAVLRVIPVNDRGEIIIGEYEKLLNDRTKIVAITHVSNSLGTINPVKVMAEMAHRVGAVVLIDGAQSIPHLRIDVKDLNADFFVFSGHKLFAPTGVGVLYGKAHLLESMPPWQGGGSMIDYVSFDKTTYQPIPYKFEAGTGSIADVAGLGSAIDYLNKIGVEKAAAYERELLAYATRGLSAIPGLKIIGTAKDKVSVISFILEGFSSQEVGKYLDSEGIAVRAGHHCAQPSLRIFGLESTVRLSLAFYNTCEEIDTFVAVIKKLKVPKA